MTAILAGLQSFGIGLLGFISALIIYFWCVAFMPIEALWQRTSFYWRQTERTQHRLVMWPYVAGYPALWAFWEFAMPDWWKEATPLFAPAIMQ